MTKDSKSKFSLDQLFFVLIACLLMGLKFYFSDTGFLNFEGSFFELARQIRESFTPLKGALYFQWQANPIGVPFFISYFESLLHFLPLSEESLARLPAILLMLPCFFLVRKVYQEFFGKDSKWSSVFFVFVVFSHPSVWTYIGKLYSDSYYVLASFAACCLYLLYRLSPKRKFFIGLSCILFLSVFVKLNAVMLLAVMGLDTILDCIQRKDFLKSIFKDQRIFLVLSLGLGLLCYFGLAHYFGIPFRQNNAALMQLSLYEMFRNVVLYNLHYFLVVAPFTLASLLKLFRSTEPRDVQRAFVGTIAIWLIFLVFFRQHTLFNTGELNFGSFVDSILIRFYSYLAPVILFLSLFYLALASLRAITIIYQKESKTFLQNFEVGLVLFLVGLLLLHSFVKPVQRYLLVFVLLHLFYFARLFHAQLKEKIALVYGLIFGAYLAVSLLLSFETQTRSDAYMALGKMLSASDEYTLRIESDDLKGNLFGSVNEKYLIPRDGKKELCVFHTGYAEPTAAALAAPIQIQKGSLLRRDQLFRISAGNCL